jgi:hypothetical protein
MIELVNLKASALGGGDWASAAKYLKCEVAALKAVWAVECAKRSYDSKGRLTMLFEPHIFHRELRGAERAAAVRAGLAYAVWGARPYPRDSYPRFLKAAAINEDAAFRSASWGGPQILGRNSELCGFIKAANMVADFLRGEPRQLEGMVLFIQGKKLDAALRDRNWARFAYGYNGRGYKTNAYDVKLARAYASASR